MKTSSPTAKPFLRSAKPRARTEKPSAGAAETGLRSTEAPTHRPEACLRAAKTPARNAQPPIGDVSTIANQSGKKKTWHGSPARDVRGKDTGWQPVPRDIKAPQATPPAPQPSAAMDRSHDGDLSFVRSIEVKDEGNRFLDYGRPTPKPSEFSILRVMIGVAIGIALLAAYVFIPSW